MPSKINNRGKADPASKLPPLAYVYIYIHCCCTVHASHWTYKTKVVHRGSLHNVLA